MSLGFLIVVKTLLFVMTDSVSYFFDLRCCVRVCMCVVRVVSLIQCELVVFIVFHFIFRTNFWFFYFEYSNGNSNRRTGG